MSRTADSSSPTVAEVQRQLAERTAERDEAEAQKAAMAEVLQVINSSAGDLAPVFDAMLEKATRLCEANAGHFFRFVDDAFIRLASRGVPPDFDEIVPPDVRIPVIENSVPERMLATKSIVHVRDLREDESYRLGAAHEVGAVEQGGFRTILFVPLLEGDEIVGHFTMLRTEVRPFSDGQIALLQSFAAQAVIAMENARLLDETREALEQQTATAEVLQVINRSPGELQPVFDVILEKAMALCDVSYGDLELYDGDTFRAVATRGLTDAFAEQVRRGYPAGDNPATRQLIAGERVSHIVNMADVDFSKVFTHEPVKGEGHQTLLCVPLRRENVLLGMIACARREVRAFSEKEIALLESFAAQAVIAIENARLITETKEALDQQTATAEVLGVINSSPGDLAPVFDAMIERAARLCEADEAALRTFDGKLLHLVAVHGSQPEVVERLRRLGPTPAVGGYEPIGRGEDVAHYSDVRETDIFRDNAVVRQRLELRGIRSWLAVALRKEGALLGVINVHRHEVRPFSDKQIALLQNFAAQAVIAMENARLITETREARDDAETALHDLKTAQASLIQAEKMASLGQLTAGIAHEIKNPLNFVNNFAGLSVELLDELKEEAAPVLGMLDVEKRAGIDETFVMLTCNLEKIAEHGKRADNIVKSMLEHSRGVTGERREVDLNNLIEEALNLAYHGARAHDASFNITLEREFEQTLAPIELAPQEMTRVCLNLFGNGFYAANKRAREDHDGSFRPTLAVATRDTGDAVEIRIRDNGVGISPDIRDKLFHPFFTTKPTGEGTGLGLSISYDIVTQQHGGTITVESEVDAYTEFTIRLPRHRPGSGPGATA